MQLTQYGTNVAIEVRPTPGETDYLLPNPSFEEGNMNFWPIANNLLFQSVFDCTTNPAFSCADGRWFLAFKRDPVNNSDPYLTDNWFDGGMGDLSGKTFRLSFQARGEFTSYLINYIGIQTRAENDDWSNGTSVYASIPPITVLPQVWQTYTYEITFPQAPAGHSTSEMRIVLRAPPNDYTAYYDDFSLRNVATLPMVGNPVRLFYTPFQSGPTANYCGGPLTNWQEIPGATYVGPPFVPDEYYSASWDISSLPASAKYYVAANFVDSNDGSCTGNPSGTCGTGFDAQCTGCRQIYTVCQPSCTPACGQADGCTNFCPTTDAGAPAIPQIDLPADGSNVRPNSVSAEYTLQIDASNVSSSAEYLEYVIYPQDDNALGTQINNATTTQLQVLASSDQRVMYGKIPFTGPGTYLVSNIGVRPAQGRNLFLVARSVNTSCNEEHSAWAAINYNLIGDVSGEFKNDPSGACSNLDIATNLPSGTVTAYKTGMMSTSQTITNASFYTFPIIPYTPYDAWVTPGQEITAKLVIHNTDLTNAHLCSTCNNVTGIQLTNVCDADYANCTCTLNRGSTGLFTSFISPSYSGQHFYIQSANLANGPWWQTWGGLVYAKNGINSKGPTANLPTSCLADASCDPHLIQTSSGSSGSPSVANTTAGIPIVSGASNINAGNPTTSYYTNRPADERVTNGHDQTGAKVEGYSYFASTAASLPTSTNGSNTSIDELSDLNTSKVTVTTGENIYSVTGNLTITFDPTKKWHLTSNEKDLVFIPGNLTIDVTDATGNLQQLTQVDQGSFLGFIVGGNITINPDVGYGGDTSLAATNTPNLDGVFLATGTLTIKSYGTTNPDDRKFVGAGSFIGITDVKMERDFSNGGLRRELNNTSPTDLFIYRPDFTINVPESLRKPEVLWRETN